MKTSSPKPSTVASHRRTLVPLLLLLLTTTPTPILSKENTVMGKKVTETLRFLSPLQSLTLFPKEDTRAHRTPRDKFLPKFRAGLAAEGRVRDTIAREDGVYDDEDGDVRDGWETRSEEEDRKRVEGEEERAEGAFDSAAAVVEEEGLVGGGGVVRSKYQFVGVVQPPSSGSGKMVKWYAKKRPKGSKWNLRLVHVNRDAIIKDLVNRGKVDIYGEYVNTGKSIEDPDDKVDTSIVSKPLIEGRYSVKERSWRYVLTQQPLNVPYHARQHFTSDTFTICGTD